MKLIRYIVLNLFYLFSALYILVGLSMYFFQEKLIFLPHKLAPDYEFKFNSDFEEIWTTTKDGVRLNGLLFKVEPEKSKGLIFYLHGNAGNLAGWGEVAQFYNQLNYDVFLLDYRGYGKSEGRIKSQNQLIEDNQLVYERLKEWYSEDKITVLGYSIGTGMAAKLAADNQPKQLILQAPFYSLLDMKKERFNFVPNFLLRYTFPIHQYLQQTQSPVIIFHGNRDYVIPIESSLKLEKEFKPGDRYIVLDGAGHNGMTDNRDYQKHLTDILK